MQNTRQLEQQAAETAAAADDKEGEVLSDAVKADTIFDVRALNTLVDALNEALKLFHGAPPVPRFTENQEVLPPAMVKSILMVLNAAKDAKLSEYDYDVGNIKVDQIQKMIDQLTQQPTGTGTQRGSRPRPTSRPRSGP